MKEYSGLWSEGDFCKEDAQYGTLTISEGEIKFKIDLRRGIVGSCTFVSQINDMYIKAYFNSFILNKVGYASRVVCCNNKESLSKIKGFKIDNIREVSFYIENLEEWLNIESIFSNGFSAQYLDIEPILIQDDDDIKIKIYYTPDIVKTVCCDKTKVTLENKPRVKIEYVKPKDIDEIYKDISNVVNFFSILIGRIDSVTDIKFKIVDSENEFIYYNTIDYTQFADELCYINESRVKYEKIEENIMNLYRNWCEFYERNEIILNNFFKLHSKRNITITDSYITWCGIVDGLYIRKYEVDNKFEILKCGIREVLEKEEINNEFKKVFNDIGEKFKVKKISELIEYDISECIANNFINKVTFATKLRDLCKDNFNYIIANRDYLKFNKETREIDIYESYNKTRNFYTHYKVDNSKCLDIYQIHKSNQLLFCTVVSVILTGIGFEKEEAKLILKQDDVASFNFQG